MQYELAKELKDAGFPQTFNEEQVHFCEDDPCKSEEDWEHCSNPTLGELIVECGEGFRNLSRSTNDEGGRWWCNIEDKEVKQGFYRKIYGKTPEEAVARLWLALNKKP